LEYPSILEGPEGILHVTYSWGNQAAIRYLRLREADLLGN
jgi:predicted neuraminidase